MSTSDTTTSHPTLRDLAINAATKANLNSFAHAYIPNPDQAVRLVTTMSKTCPPLTRLINICDSGLVKQLAFFKHAGDLAVISCPFPASSATNDAVIAGTLGDSLNIICPITISMRDVKRHVISITASKSTAVDTFNLAISTSDPLDEEGPLPDDLTAPDPAGPDRIFVEVTDPTAAPCFALFPKLFAMAGGYSITPMPTTDETPTPATTGTEAFTMWKSALQYGITHLQNHSLQAQDTLFVYESLEKPEFTAADRELSPTFTTTITYLTPDDVLYHEITKYALVEKEKAIVAFGSQSVPPPASLPSIPPSPERHGTDTSSNPPSPTSVTDMTSIIDGLSKAITNSKTLTGTERERVTEAEEVTSFYQILLASIHELLQPDGTTKTTLVKAKLNPLFVKHILQANKNSKATKAMQDLIEETSSVLSTEDNRFAAASNLHPRMLDQPLVAALRSGMWEHQHTVLHPNGIKTHFGLHHITPPRTWSATYKSRQEGEMKLVRQEQVEEDKSRLQAKTTDLYHTGKMGSLADINEMLGNFFALIRAITEFDPESPPTIWMELLAFDRLFRTQEGRQWFDLHRNIREVPFNIIQDLQSTLAGFVAEARKPGYRNAITTGIIISPRIFQLATQQGIEFRRTMQSTILTMSAGHYNLIPLTYKFFQPEQFTEKTKKRESSTPVTDLAHQPPRQRQATSTPISNNYGNTTTLDNASTRPSARDTAHSPPGPQALAGKKVFKIIGEQNMKLPHPGPIFPHPSKPAKFTLMCCRSAYEGKQCPLNPCNFYHFPSTLSNVPISTKEKLQAWLTTQPNIEWNSSANSWGSSPSAPAGN